MTSNFAQRRHIVDRIGDMVVTVFGPKEFEDTRDDTGAGHILPSHASTLEQDVPIVGYIGDFDGFEFTRSGNRPVCIRAGTGLASLTAS